MKESSYAGRESRDDIKKDPKYLRLTPDAKKAADKELEKGGMVDLGEEMLEEMEFFPVAVEVPSELPEAEEVLISLQKQADDLVDSSYIEVDGNTILVTFMRRSDANNFKEFARTLGIPEEYVEEPASTRDTEIEDELYEVVMDSNGNELFVNDVVVVGAKRFKIAENNEGTASLFTLSGKEVIPVMDPRAHTLLRHSVKEETYKTDYQKRREAEQDYKKPTKDVPPKPFKEPKNDYFARRKKELGEDLDIGHEDDEPGMLKATVYDILDYATKLYKQLGVYDKMNTEVDFPNWWQAKIIKARDNISAAQHYLEFEEKEPALDAMALEENVTSEYEETLKWAVDTYHDGDPKVLQAAIEYAGLKASRAMGGRSATDKLFRKFHMKYDPEVVSRAIDAIMVADEEDMYEGTQTNERININPEAEATVVRFIKALAKKYSYGEQDAAFLIKQVLSNQGLDEAKQINERSSVLDDLVHDIRVHGEESGDIQGTAAEYIFHIANAFDINLNNIKDYLFEEQKSYDDIAKEIFGLEYDQLDDSQKEEVKQVAQEEEDDPHPYNMVKEEGPSELNKIYDVILKYVKDPDEAMEELDNFVSQGKDGFSDELYANLVRDPEFISIVKHMLKERFYHNYTGRYSTFEKDKRDFKRKELEAELGHETNDIGIFINDKLWKRLEVDPSMGYSFSEEARRRQALKMKNSIEAGARQKGWKVPKVEISLIGSLR